MNSVFHGGSLSSKVTTLFGVKFEKNALIRYFIQFFSLPDRHLY